MNVAKTSNLDWNNLGFTYHRLPYRYIAQYRNGKWGPGKLTQNCNLSLNECATCLHYGQDTFEGMKAYRTKNNHINLFRPDRNAHRFHNSCKRLYMPPFPEDRFVSAVKKMVKTNDEFVPPYGNGATMYIRPLMLGVGPTIGVQPSSAYTFIVFGLPVGSYLSGGQLNAVKLDTLNYDRAAHFGTGRAKVSGNYGGSILPNQIATKQGYADVLYLDPLHHHYVEESGGANFFAITKDNVFVTPKSISILPSITKYSLLYLVQHRLGMKAVQGHIDIRHLDQYKEAGLCGTAAVIVPVGGINYKGHMHLFNHGKTGKLTLKLYHLLSGIQFGDVKAPKGWIQRVE